MQNVDLKKSTTRIFLNPEFKKPKVHVNPNFLQCNPSTAPAAQRTSSHSKIHINPKFLKESVSVHHKPSENVQLVMPVRPPLVVTRRKLIRAIKTKTEVLQKTIIEPSNSPSTHRLLTLSRNKVIRYQPQKIRMIPVQKTISRPSKSKYKLKNLLQSTFKIDRRSIKTTSSKYAAKKKLGYSLQSKHKKLVRVNINGVAYKSSGTKLRRSVSKPSGEQVLIVRGEKFQLDAAGTHLLQIDGEGPRKRIDVGGVTFVRNPSTNTFIRTESHWARNHLNSTKQRSITVLSQNLVKHNQPCPIYRRLGKCLAQARGRCPKIHDPNQISICQRFLKGQCTYQDCLLSHKVSLSKMPTCKFFLQGVCVNTECPYLHKKMNRSIKICENFNKGFCILADQCPKRHEFECLDFETTGQCTKKDCMQVHRTKKKSTEKALSNVTATDDRCIQRYYIETNETISERRERVLANVQNMKAKFTGEPHTDASKLSTTVSQIRPQLGSTPAFIPI